MVKKLESEFYHRRDVVKIAKELLGKILVTNWKGIITSGRIVECEAYAGVIDKASHGAMEARHEEWSRAQVDSIITLIEQFQAVFASLFPQMATFY